MRVCMLAYAFYESDMRILRYASALASRGDSVDVIALRRKGAPTFEVLQGVNVYRIQSRERNEQGWPSYLYRMTRFLFLSAFVLARKHIADPYDIIHVHSVPDFLVFAAIVPKLLGARVILDIHDILPEFFASKFAAGKDSAKFKLLLLAERLSVRFSDHVIVANDLWQERLLKRSAHTEQCTAIINYPDPLVFQPVKERASATSDTFVVMYPGTLNEHQGLDIAIRAVAMVRDQVPGLQFHIYGEGSAKPALLELTKELDVSDSVVFHDFLPCQQIAAVMADANLAVVPKRASSEFGNEAMSTKIMEFMCLKVPVIVSRTAVDTYYHDESRVKFFDSENVPDLAESIVLMHRDRKVRELLVSNASHYVHLNNWQQKKCIYFQLVDGLCQMRPGIAQPLSNSAN